MSMYTQLLDAALGQRSAREPDMSEVHAVEEVRRCRQELEVGLPIDGDLDDVPAVLALQIGYDVALLDLAAVVGIESGPRWFEQPERERDRLRRALLDMGILLDATAAAAERAEADLPRD
jgi:hypothetical protein